MEAVNKKITYENMFVDVNNDKIEVKNLFEKISEKRKLLNKTLFDYLENEINTNYSSKGHSQRSLLFEKGILVNTNGSIIDRIVEEVIEITLDRSEEKQMSLEIIVNQLHPSFLYLERIKEALLCLEPYSFCKIGVKETGSLVHVTLILSVFPAIKLNGGIMKV